MRIYMHACMHAHVYDRDRENVRTYTHNILKKLLSEKHSNIPKVNHVCKRYRCCIRANSQALSVWHAEQAGRDLGRSGPNT
jgi:hypothetical protein